MSDPVRQARSSSSISRSAIARVLGQVCGSLAEAHGLGLIHRDIKPANIILSHRGGVPDFVKVLDFGLAKSVGTDSEARLTGAATMPGTPLYLAPEAVDRPDTVDARADLYAVGAVGYFILTGTPVFRGNTIMELCMQHLKAPPEPPSQRLGRPISAPLESLLLQCLAKNANDRPHGAMNVAEDLKRITTPQKWSTADAEAWWNQYKTGSSTAPFTPARETETERVAHTLAYVRDSE
jgi:eukaryotic-like serine/threonine-protein kinase